MIHLNEALFFNAEEMNDWEAEELKKFPIRQYHRAQWQKTDLMGNRTALTSCAYIILCY